MSDDRSGRFRVRMRAGVGALALVVLLAACGATSESGGDAADNSGKITIGTIFPPGTLDPTTGTQGSDVAYLDFVFDRLIQVNPESGALEPMLATSWEFVGADKLTFKVELRKGVKFHDGTPFNAQAVVDYSEDFIEAGNIANLLQYVTKVTAEDDHTVIYHLSQQNARLPYGLTARAGMIPSPTAVEKAGDDFAAHPVGTGPYKFDSLVQGASYTFTRFEDYWNDAEVKRVKNVEFEIFQSDTALVSAIKSGQANVALHLFPQDVESLKPVSNLDVSVGPGNAIGIAYFNSSRAPLDDRRVRLAINLALDREPLAETVTAGLGTVATQSLPSGVHGYLEDMEPVWEQDVAKAKELMEEAGYADGVDLACFAYPGLGFETGGPIIISQLKEIGIDLTITPGTPAQVGPFFTDKADEQCALANWGSADPFKGYQLLWSQSYYNAGKTNYGIDKYYDQFYTTYNRKGEEEIVRKILESQRTNPGYAPMFRSPLVNVYQKNIGGWVTSNLGIANWRGLYYES